MSKSTSVLFKKSLIAAAVLSLGACSSTPRIGDYDLGSVGDGIAKAGRTTADASGRVWNKTTYLLGFSDDDGETISDEGLLMDAEDVARLNAEANKSRDSVVQPIVIRSATPSYQNPAPINTGQGDQLQTPIHTSEQITATVTSAPQLEQTLEQTPTVVQRPETPEYQTPPGQDLIHEVGIGETLWDIAKKTTGDATNWHILADTNNLGPGASVFPGQDLIIPADMRKSVDNIQLEEPDTQQAAADRYINTQNLTDSSSTPITNATNGTTHLATDQEVLGKTFTVKPGETLWDFSKRVTGDATNWQLIAGENNFTDKQASYIKTGQTIYVPESLVKPELDTAQSLNETLQDENNAQLSLPKSEQQTALPTPRITEQHTQDEAKEELAITVITSASAASRTAHDSVLRNSAQDTLNNADNALEDAQPIKIVEATFKSSQSPTTTALPSTSNNNDEAMVAPDKINQLPTQITVSGTYYPKAVYNEADFSSSLLMRVSPGTSLQVSKVMGSWYQVKTDKGLGYVNQRDIK